MNRFQLNDRARKFVREVGSIVLGVLIALGIGEIADNLRHRANAKRAMEAVRTELSGSGVSLEERMMIGRCLARRLESIQAALTHARVSGILPAFVSIGRPPHRAVVNTAWQVLLESGELLHVPADDRVTASQHFTTYEVYRQIQEKEQEA